MSTFVSIVAEKPPVTEQPRVTPIREDVRDDVDGRVCLRQGNAMKLDVEEGFVTGHRQHGRKRRHTFLLELSRRQVAGSFRLDPRLPAGWDRLRFRWLHRGTPLTITVGPAPDAPAQLVKLRDPVAIKTRLS